MAYQWINHHRNIKLILVITSTVNLGSCDINLTLGVAVS